MTCPHCGTDTPAGAARCARCGAPHGATAPLAPADLDVTGAVPGTVGAGPGAEFETEVPRPLFETHIREDPDRHYDVSADGQRFLLDSPVGEDTTPPITLVQNWTALLRQNK